MITEVALAEVCDIRSGGTPSRGKKEYYGGSIPWAKIGDLERADTVVETEDYISEAGLRAIRGRIFPKGTLLFAIYGSMGKMAFAGTELSTNQAILGIQPLDPDTIDLKYLYHYLSQRLEEMQDAGRGVTQKNLSATYIRELKVPLPQIHEQRRIAAILDKADAIRTKRDRLKALSADFVKSSYVHTMGHLNPQFDHWEPCSIEQLAVDRKGAIRSGPFGSALRHGEFVHEGIAVLGIDNAVQNKFAWAQRRYITVEKYQELRRYRVYPNDVIITIMGTTGRSAVVPHDIPEAITTKHLATVTCDPEKVLPDVLSFAIHSDPMIIRQIKAHNKGAIMDGLNLGIIKQLVLKRPPMELQRQFSKIVRKTEGMLSRSSRPDLSGEELLSSLSQRAFRGEL